MTRNVRDIALMPLAEVSARLQSPIILPIRGDMKATIPTTMRELHSRVNDGIHVRLLWSECEGRLAVAVTDTRTADAFCIEVRDGESALEVFNHPFAYAAWHGVDTAGAYTAGASDIPLAA